jgi:exopolysaccharide production protein ExoZ
MASQPKLQSVQVLRAIAALLVVVHHQVDVEARYGLGQPLLTHFIGGFGVDIFFVISGFVMFYVGADKPSGHESVKRFLVARVARIAPLYWFYTLLFAGMGLLLQRFNKPTDLIDVTHVAKSLLFWPQQGALPLVHQGWTLSYELFFYLIFALSLFLERRRIPILIVVLLSLVLSGTLLHHGPHKALLVATSPLLIEFILGMLIARLFDSTFVVPFSVALIGGVCGFAALFALSPLCHYESDMWERLLMWGLPSAIVVLAATQMDRNGKINLPWLSAVGDASYSLYLSHTFVLPVLGRLWHKFGMTSDIVYLGVVLAACLLVAFVSYHRIEVPLIRLTTRLFGRSPQSIGKPIEMTIPAIGKL